MYLIYNTARPKDIGSQISKEVQVLFNIREDQNADHTPPLVCSMQDKSHIPTTGGAMVCQLDLFPPMRNSQLSDKKKQTANVTSFKHPGDFTASQRE